MLSFGYVSDTLKGGKRAIYLNNLQGGMPLPIQAIQVDDGSGLEQPLKKSVEDGIAS